VTIAALTGGTAAEQYDPIWAESTVPDSTKQPKPASSPKLNGTITGVSWIATVLDHLSNTQAAGLFKQHAAVVVPDPKPRVVPKLQEMVLEVRRLTGWSERTLASRVGTSHPTIAAAASGSSQAFVRSPHAYARLEALHSIVIRIAPLASGGPLDVDRALTTPPGPGRVSATANLETDDVSGAYLAALDVLRPPSSGGKIRSRFPRVVGNDTAALTD
jgi:hypothetical protein